MKHEYWIIFPQGIREIHYNGNSGFSRMMVAHSKEDAWNLLEKYDGAWIEKMQYRRFNGKFGRYSMSIAFSPYLPNDVTEKLAWDLFENKPEIVITEG